MGEPVVTVAVIVVGAGASGTLTALALLRSAAQTGTPLQVTLVDDATGPGPAYRTSDRLHLLNVTAGGMSALSDQPEHFLRWARRNLPAGERVQAGDFLPRAEYGRYLRHLLATAGQPPGPGRLERVTGRATQLVTAGPVRVGLSDGRWLSADVAVLALGGLPAARPGCPDLAGPGFLPDPWAPGRLEQVADGRPVLAVGTGLTMVDVALSATAAHPDTVVHALSRRGLLPHSHRSPVGMPAPFEALPSGDTTLTQLLAVVRRRLVGHGGDWREVVDGMRPHTQRLWQQLGPAEQRRFLARVARYWDVHRHRMAPRVAERVADLRRTGRLRLYTGRLAQAEPVAGAAGGFDCRLETAAGTQVLRPGWIIDCTGPGTDVSATTDPLLNQLLASGQGTSDPHRLGLDTAPTGALIDRAGWPSDRLFAVGPLRRGTLYESTAIPEIRAQAGELAELVVAEWGRRLPATRTSPDPDRAKQPVTGEVPAR